MNTADFNTQPDGFPLESDATLGFMQSNYESGIKALCALAGSDAIIISGMAESGGNIADGWIWYGGDLVFFQGGVKAAQFVINTFAEQKANQNGTLVDRYFTKTAQFGSGTGAINFSVLKRISNLDQLTRRFAKMIGLEDAVILSGCTVSSVLTGPSTLAIAAGTVLLDGNFLEVNAYAGQYPVYLNLAGEYTLILPDDTHIKFDPYTSQYYVDVIRRNTTRVGEMRMIKTTSDRFDGTGLGKWEWKGFAMCNGSNGSYDMRGRFPAGYDNRATDPGGAGSVWRPEYFVPGTTGGKDEVALTISELPPHNHTGNGGNAIAPGQAGLVRKSVSGEGRTVSGVDASGSGTEPDVLTAPIDIPSQGGGQAHENLPPFLVIVYIERIAI